MYNTGEMPGFEPSMLQNTYGPNTLGVIGFSVQLVLIALIILYPIYINRKHK